MAIRRDGPPGRGDDEHRAQHDRPQWPQHGPTQRRGPAGAVQVAAGRRPRRRLGIGERPGRQQRGEPDLGQSHGDAATVLGVDGGDRLPPDVVGPQLGQRLLVGQRPGGPARPPRRRPTARRATPAASRARCGRRPTRSAGGGAATARAAAVARPPATADGGRRSARRARARPAARRRTRRPRPLRRRAQSCAEPGLGARAGHVEAFEQRLGQAAGGVRPPPRPVVDPPVGLEERREVADGVAGQLVVDVDAVALRRRPADVACDRRAAPRPAASARRRRSPSASTASGSAAWSPASTRRGGPSPGARRRSTSRSIRYGRTIGSSGSAPTSGCRSASAAATTATADGRRRDDRQVAVEPRPRHRLTSGGSVGHRRQQRQLAVEARPARPRPGGRRGRAWASPRPARPARRRDRPRSAGRSPTAR